VSHARCVTDDNGGVTPVVPGYVIYDIEFDHVPKRIRVYESIYSRGRWERVPESWSREISIGPAALKVPIKGIEPSTGLTLESSKLAHEWFSIASERYDANKFDDASKFYEHALKFDPKNVGGRFNYALSLALLNKYDTALEEVKKLQKIQPRKFDVPYLKGIIYKYMKSYDKSGLCFELALERISKSEEKTKLLTEYMKLAQEVYDRNEFERAERFWQRICTLSPDDHSAHFKPGMSLDNLRKYSEAMDAFEQAKKLNPNDSDAYRMQGTVLYHSKEYSKAIDVFNQVKKLDPDNAAVYNSLAMVHALMGNFEEALNEIDKALEMRPKETIYYMTLYEVYALKGDYKRANEVTRRRLEANQISCKDICEELKECLTGINCQEWETEILIRMQTEFCAAR